MKCFALPAILVAVSVAIVAPHAFAQGSAGGTIGKQNKSASGSEEAPAAAPKSRRAREPKVASCPNIVGIWSSWASGLFGQNDTTFNRDGSSIHKSGINGNWKCEGGKIILQWANGERHALTFSADGKQAFTGDRLVFSRN